MLTNRNEFIQKVKETSFYQEFVEDLFILQGEAGYVYYSPKKSYATADVGTTDGLADEYEIILADVICLTPEEKSHLIKL